MIPPRLHECSDNMTVESKALNRNNYLDNHSNNIFTITKKTRRKTSMLQIDIECIEDEYDKIPTVGNSIYQDTLLFATVSQMPNPE
jgi:hypothetical protein